MTIDFRTAIFETITRTTGVLATGSAVLAVTAFSSLANACGKPTLFYYYAGVMQTSGKLAMFLSILCVGFFAISSLFIKEEPRQKWPWSKRIVIACAALLLIALAFSPVYDTVYLSRELMAKLFSIPMVPGKSMSAEDFCKAAT